VGFLFSQPGVAEGRSPPRASLGLSSPETQHKRPQAIALASLAAYDDETASLKLVPSLCEASFPYWSRWVQ
jgi:hypothetical protein